jgi:hypothetical protein
MSIPTPSPVSFPLDFSWEGLPSQTAARGLRLAFQPMLSENENFHSHRCYASAPSSPRRVTRPSDPVKDMQALLLGKGVQNPVHNKLVNSLKYSEIFL